ncbi:hypothetical protein EDC04DRAFT_2890115 [Pisolithus marmoratus]|nr:hypothetical protein EDC04DRAFT_2890115 [Pisolithus marmoratus]
MAESSYESSNHSSEEQLDPPPAGAKGTTLRDDEICILQDNVQNWIAGDAAKRKTIFKNIGDAVLQLSPNKNLKKHHWEAKKKVLKTWLFNHSHKQSQKKLVTYGQRWNMQSVIAHQQKERIHSVLEWSGYKPGTSTWISKYQGAVAKVMKSMSAEELDQAKETADTWNNTRAPAEVQSQAAEAKGRQYAKQFVEEMWKQCGVQVVVMVAWSSADNDVLTAFHDYNDEIGDGKLFDNWGRMQDRWAQYTQNAFRQEADDPQNMDGESPLVPKVCKGQKQPEVALMMSTYGTPEIPTILNMTVQEKMDVANISFIGKASGWPKAAVPWSVVCNEPTTFIAPQYLPPNFKFKEPTWLTSHELTTLLEWWWDRQVCKPWDVFQFKMWVQSDGSTHPPVASKDVGSNQAGSLQCPMRKNTKGKGKANDGHDDDEWEDIDIDVLSDSTDTDDLVDNGWIHSDTMGSHSNGDGPSTEPRTRSKPRLDSERDGDSSVGKSLGTAFLEHMNNLVIQDLNR